MDRQRPAAVVERAALIISGIAADSAVVDHNHRTTATGGDTTTYPRLAATRGVAADRTVVNH